MSTRDIMARAMQRVLAVRGRDALLRGAPGGSIVVQHSVHLDPGMMDRADDNPVVAEHVVTLDKALDPRVGDEVEHPEEGKYLLDRRLRDNGFLAMFIAVKLP